MKIQFTIPGTPVAKARPRVTRTGHAYTPKKTSDYEKLVQIYAKQAMAGMNPTTEAVRLTVRAFFPIPKSWTKAKKEKALCGCLWPTGKPDIDNCQKAIQDAFNGIVYKDDSQVVYGRCIKAYAAEPRVEVTVETV